MYYHNDTVTHEKHPYMSRGFPVWDLKKKDTPQTTNILDGLIELYATFYGIKEPVGMDTFINKTTDGWRDEMKRLPVPWR